MDQKQRTTVAADTKRFFEYARELGKSVYRRINQAAKLKDFIDFSLELNEKIAQKIDLSRSADLTFRDHCHTVINSCAMLGANLEKQKEASINLLVLEALDQKTEKRLRFKTLMASESVQKGLALAEQMRARVNQITLIDYRMASHVAKAAARIREAVDAVTRLHEYVTGDWSAYCVNEKAKEAEEQLYARIDAIMDSADIKDMQRMLEDVMVELQAEDVLSASLGAQAPASAAMTATAQDLFIDATCIRSLMEEKCDLVRKNLEEGAQLSVILSLEIADYLKIREVLDPGQVEGGLSEEARRGYLELGVLFDIALNAIESLVELNQYSVEISSTDVKRDDQVMELANMYYHCHGSIRKESDSAEQLLTAVADGSHRNIIIGQVLEKNIRKILESYGV
jgi:hypothetical protein